MKGMMLCIGAGPGIGIHTAARFASEGYAPILAARNEARLQEEAEQITKQTGSICRIEKVNAGNPAEVSALIQKYGEKIQIVMYNAAILRPQTIWEATDNSIISDLSVDLAGAFVSVRNVLPYMKKKGEGTIFLTGGGFALHPVPEYLALSVGKAGIRCLCQGLFKNLREDNIHIATILIKKTVKPEDDDPAKLAELFWSMFLQPKDKWSWEETYG